MNKELLLDMFYAAPEVWYLVLAAFFALSYATISNSLKLIGLRKKNYYCNRDKERYAETLYACRDGYFAFIYPDDGENATIQRCSRRLAVILNLTAGIDSNIDEVLKNFYKDDAEKVSKYIALLKEDGVSFEDQFELKNGKRLLLNGVRINGGDGTVYSDIIWFRDISRNAEYIDALIREKEITQNNLQILEDLIDNIPYPIWMRNHNLNLMAINKKYLEFADCPDKDTVIVKSLEIEGLENDGKKLAKQSQDSNRPQKQSISLNKGGERFCYEIVETPFLFENSLDKIATVGIMTDISELDKIKRNLKQNQNTHLEILGALDTAFAVFDSNFKLNFCNQAFNKLWGIEESFIEQQPSYGSFLDYLREKRLLPEVPDYPYYKSEEQKMFSSIIIPKQDLLHLPDGRSLRRIRAPHLKGGLVFAFEDISDRLAASREYNSLMSVQQEILNNIEEAVLIFASNGKLKFYNQAYVNLWDADEILLQKEPTLADILETQKTFFNKVNNWEELKKDIISHIFSSNTKAFSLSRSDNQVIECFSALLSNESIMVLMHKVPSISI